MNELPHSTEEAPLKDELQPQAGPGRSFRENGVLFLLNGSAEAQGPGWMMEMKSDGTVMVRGSALKKFGLSNNAMGAPVPTGDVRKVQCDLSVLRLMATRNEPLAAFLRDVIEPAVAHLTAYMHQQAARRNITNVIAAPANQEGDILQ